MANENQSGLIASAVKTEEVSPIDKELSNNVDDVDVNLENPTETETRDNQRPQLIVGFKRELDRFNQFARNMLTQARQKYNRLNMFKQKDSDRKQEEMTLNKDDGNMNETATEKLIADESRDSIQPTA